MYITILCKRSFKAIDVWYHVLSVLFLNSIWNQYVQTQTEAWFNYRWRQSVKICKLHYLHREKEESYNRMFPWIVWLSLLGWAYRARFTQQRLRRPRMAEERMMPQEKWRPVRTFSQTLVLIRTVISPEILKTRQCHFLAIHNRVQSENCHPYVYHGPNKNGRKGNRGFNP